MPKHTIWVESTVYPVANPTRKMKLIWINGLRLSVIKSSVYQGVRFLDQSGLLPLNRYLATTFLGGEYDETCYTLEVDAAMLRTALTDFRGCDECRNIMQDPFERAIQWLEAKQDNEQRLLSYNVS